MFQDVVEIEVVTKELTFVTMAVVEEGVVEVATVAAVAVAMVDSASNFTGKEVTIGKKKELNESGA